LREILHMQQAQVHCQGPGLPEAGLGAQPRKDRDRAEPRARQ
jgi:hypothetical protein